ncbi:MAG: hypothetical protein LCI00_29480 [Chloroflexi bacterium]|nr:hypothetical protein [Chloroflexota bacterium]MCC6893667.1 hypothetical protein [Anaerolineae bacterium]
MAVDRVAATPVRPVTTEVAVTTPLDRVRWTSVIAGFFTVLATIIVLTVLGVAIGLSTVDADNPNGLALGISVYGGLTALIAFLAGGYISARTAAVAGSSNGILNGAMVWIITIPILVYVLGNGIGSLLGTAADLTTKAATVGAQVVGPVAGEVAGQIAANPDTAATTVAGVAGEATAAIGVTPDPTALTDTVQGQAQSAVATVQTQIDGITPAQVEQTAQDASRIAWVTLLALGLSAAAAIGGGYAGARTLISTAARVRTS